MPEINWDSPLIKAIPNILALLILIFILAFVLVQFGFLRCCDIPYFCPIYYGIVGNPELAIIYGEGEYQVGDPNLLHNAIIQRKMISPAMYPIDAVVSAEMLNQYALIFVEAKKIDTATLQRFRSYLSKGGKLVWIGESGTVLGDDDYMCQPVNFKYLPATSGYTSDLCGVLKTSEKECIEYESGWTKEMSDDISDVTGGAVGSEKKCKKYKEGGDDYIACINHQCDALTGGAKQICESVSTGKQPADSWFEYSPNDPYDMEAGLCGKTFGEIITKFKTEKDDLFNKLTTGGMSLFDDESFIVEDAQNLETCVELLGGMGLEITTQNANDHCTFDPEYYKFGANYWNRGPSETLTGDYVDDVNFATVLGIDFIDLSEEVNLVMRPILTDHPLITNYEIEKYFGKAKFCKVSTTRFAVRSNTIMSVDFANNDWWPAIVVSQPLGPSVGGRGLIVYFSFAPETGLESAEKGPGANLIDNIVDFALCA